MINGKTGSVPLNILSSVCLNRNANSYFHLLMDGVYIYHKDCLKCVSLIDWCSYLAQGVSMMCILLHIFHKTL